MSIIKLPNLPKGAKNGDMIIPDSDIGLLDKGQLYFVVDFANKKVIKAGADGGGKVIDSSWLNEIIDSVTVEPILDGLDLYYKFTWTYKGDNPQNFTIYRSTSPIEPGTLPNKSISVNHNAPSEIDETVFAKTKYYYAIVHGEQFIPLNDIEPLNYTMKDSPLAGRIQAEYDSRETSTYYIRSVALDKSYGDNNTSFLLSPGFKTSSNSTWLGFDYSIRKRKDNGEFDGINWEMSYSNTLGKINNVNNNYSVYRMVGPSGSTLWRWGGGKITYFDGVNETTMPISWEDLDNLDSNTDDILKVLIDHRLVKDLPRKFEFTVNIDEEEGMLYQNEMSYGYAGDKPESNAFASIKMGSIDCDENNPYSLMTHFLWGKGSESYWGTPKDCLSIRHTLIEAVNEACYVSGTPISLTISIAGLNIVIDNPNRTNIGFIELTPEQAFWLPKSGSVDVTLTLNYNL